MVQILICNLYIGGYSEDAIEVLPTLIYCLKTKKWRRGAPIPHSASSAGRSFGNALEFQYTFLAIGGNGAPDDHSTQVYEPIRDEWFNFNRNIVEDKKNIVAFQVPASFARCNAYNLPPCYETSSMTYGR